MKKILLASLLAGFVAAGVVFANGAGDEVNTGVQAAASLNQTLKADQTAAISDSFGPVVGKKCNFQSDCKYGKCKRGRCGACDFQSDCRGWGKCKRGHCGACDFQSDCKKKGFGTCRSGRCTKSPY